MEEIKIYIADDYYLIREGIKKSLKSLKGAVIVGETHDLSILVSDISICIPHIVIIELNLCERPIRDLVEEIKKSSPLSKLLIISDCDCELPVVSAIRAGVSGFIKKTVTKNELIKAVLELSEGRDYFTPEITQLLLKGYLSDKNSELLFSDRELEVLRYIGKGRSNEQIADILFISESTIATHRRNIMKKAGVKKTSDLILWALDNKIIIKN